MDFVTLAYQLLGGVLAAVLANTWLRGLKLGLLGGVLVGIVGGALGGLVLTAYVSLAPAMLPDGTLGAPLAIVAHIASGGAGGLALAILTGLLKGLVRA